MTLTIGSLFTGYAGLDMAAEHVFGARTVWHCEYEPPSKSNPRPSRAAARLLEYRFPTVPNHGDVTTVNWSTVDPVGILTGGFPCQDVSSAGKRAGLRPGTRSGLWSHMAYAISQLRPAYVVAENVRGLLSAEAHSDVEPCPWCLGDTNGEPPVRALGAVLADLADLGYDARWHGLRAADVGAPHGRFRIFIFAADTCGEAGRSEARIAVSGGRPGSDGQRPAQPGRRRSTPSDAEGDGRPGGHLPAEPARLAGQPRNQDRSGTAPDPSRDRWHQGWPEPAGQLRRPDAAERSTAPTDTDGDGLALVGRQQPVERDPDRRGGPDIAWGAYEPAIRRWEHILGRVAPAPTEPGPKGGPRLSPRFVEWMQGLADGWVTDVPGTTRNDQLQMLGNGVVPQQAEAALRGLIAAHAGAVTAA